jgi:hypothetical protein
VSSTCMTVTIITDSVMAQRRAGEMGPSVMAEPSRFYIAHAARPAVRSRPFP